MPEVGVVSGIACVDDVGLAITEDRPQQFIGPLALAVDSQNLPKPVKYYLRKSKARMGSKKDASLLVGEWFSVINAPLVMPISFDLSPPLGFVFEGSFGLCSAEETIGLPLVTMMSDAGALFVPV